VHRRALLALLILVSGSVPAADTVTVGVASNFSRAATELSTLFTAQTGIAVRLSNGSTGKLYAQIRNGAPFDVFLSADVRRPELLEQSGDAVAGSRFTYAEGALVLWSRDAPDCLAVLQDVDAGHVALANPETAPYGRAAKEFLTGQGYWDAVAGRAVYGENIMQTLQFAATGNAVLGVVAHSHLADPRVPDAACTWAVPVTSHTPIRQQAVLLATGADNGAAKRFLEFLGSDDARDVITRYGYGVPE